MHAYQHAVAEVSKPSRHKELITEMKDERIEDLQLRLSRTHNKSKRRAVQKLIKDREKVLLS